MINPIGHRKSEIFTTEELLAYLSPESDLERQFLADQDFKDGLYWGKPRFGHPEGQVVYHIREVLDNVDQYNVDAEMRRRLRIITFVHDTFKYKEDKGFPRDFSRHHSILARLFLEKYSKEQLLLDIVELHDEAYYCWKLYYLNHEREKAIERLKYLLSRLGEHRQLYYLFFKADTQTGDKNQAPLRWFEENVDGIDTSV